jgi:hypothetical protein
VNGYSNDDYILAVLSRVSEASWKVAGLHPVEGVPGIDNVLCPHVDAHLKWRGLIGRSLQVAGVADVVEEEVEIQMDGISELEPFDGDATPEPALHTQDAQEQEKPATQHTTRTETVHQEMPKSHDWHPLA